MTSASARYYPISDAEKTAFAEDGVICLRQRFDMGWIACLQQAEDEILTGWDATLEFTAKGKPGRFAMGLFPWRIHWAFRDYIFRSPAAAMAGEIMNAAKVNLLHDKLLVKEPGTTDATNWHQDVTFWPVEGKQICTIWLALDPVTRETGGVEFIAGSHTWPERYRPGTAYTPELSRKRNMDLPSFPGADDTHRILHWDMEPGDCLVFHGVVMHGSGGNTSSTVRRRVHASHWCGDDVTYVDDDFVLPLPERPALATGDPLDSDLFPVVWRRTGW